jgi:hypothetical protein
MREIDFVAEGAGTASYWKAIGVDVEITKSEAATHEARLREYVYGEMISWISEWTISTLSQRLRMGS